MIDILSFFEKHFNVFFVVCLVWPFMFFGYRLYKRKQKGSIFPDISKQTILFRETFASGKSLSTKLKGGASNCLKIVVTDKEIWTTSFFPFTAIIDMFGLENRILKENVLKWEEQKSFFGGNSVIITYRDNRNITKKLEIYSKHHKSFIEAIDSK